MNLTLTAASKYGLGALALIGVSLGLYLGRLIFVPFIIAAMLASILYPWARTVQRTFKLPWFFSCCSVIGVLLTIFILMFALVALSIPQIVSDLPTDDTKQREMYKQLRGQVERAFPFIDQHNLPHEPEQSGFYAQVQKFMQGEYITQGLLKMGGEGLNVLWQTVLVLFVLLFLLLEGRMLTDKIRNIFGPGFGVQQQITSAFREMSESVRSYLIWRTLVNFGLAIFLGLVYYSIGLKQYMLWSVLTFIFCYIPYLGTIAAGAPPILEAIVHPGLGAPYAMGILFFYSMVVTFEGYIIVPWVMGRSMDLNATVVIMSCIYWELVWGTAGLFLAMPLMAAIKAICMQVEGWNAWGHLMSSEDLPPLQTAEPKPTVPDELVTMKLTPEKPAENVTPSPLS